MPDYIRRAAAALALIPITCIKAFAEPSGRGWDPDAPDIGLPDGSEVGIGVLIAIVAIPLGYALIQGSDKNSSDISATGCLGTILCIGGAIALLPLVAWVFAAMQVLFAIGIVVIVVIVILAAIFGSKK